MPFELKSAPYKSENGINYLESIRQIEENEYLFVNEEAADRIT